ncbi:MAG: beta-lactamase family protein [Stenotrophomonas acidaminiphila]|uniref:serine hydrolase domain-containing protein n=1 Tax=Stenotrophomonas acidaminiphila TaxID=128780 RepID=UPI000B198196|nr:serine hydrolase domain-containing protein [Stenotrophomonas acidaminiphila]MBN8802644.1 beta-lactamase family protein [Stenotrophomonas acidaminiphila]MDF9443216.1 class A beta-lactamase-related serine hydrolase [Stenotrophomonas acidaminiphila]
MKRLAALLLLLPACALAHAAHPAPVPTQEIHGERLDQFLSYVEDNNGGIGSISIFKGGREVYARSFGQNRLPGFAHDADSRYQIASVTKMVTAILVFKLVEDGRLSLDDRLSDFLPDMPSSRKITVRNLLEHSSGLGNFAVRNGTVWVVDEVGEPEILEEIKRQGVAFEPGERVAYSNSAYFLLRMILEQKHGRAYHEIVAREIAEPLGLGSLASVGSHPANTFKSYAFAGQWQEIKDIAYTNVIGVGDIASTTRDLDVLITRLFQYGILRRETLEQMKPALGSGWGRGLAEFTYGENRFLGHAGDVLGSHSRVIYNPADELAIAYSTNGERIPTNAFLETVVGIVYGDEVVFPQIR